jgi:hypothetical protein
MVLSFFFALLALAPFVFAEYEVLHGAPSTLQSGDQFGYYCAAAGPILVVTAPYANSGAGEAFVYLCPSGASSCQQTQVLTALGNPVNQTFGYAVAVGANGSTVVIVANLPDESGMLYVYNCSASGQCQLASNITDDNPVAGDLFGYGIFMDDDMLIVGAPGKKQ